MLARHRVPAFLIHGDADKVVPLEANSAAFVDAYRAGGAADAVTLVVAEGQGHNYWEGFFRCRELVAPDTTIVPSLEVAGDVTSVPLRPGQSPHLGLG